MESSCFGWSLSGKYRVMTTSTGESIIVIDSVIEAPYNLTDDAELFFSGWSVIYGVWEDKSEIFLGIHKIDTDKRFGFDWSTKTIKRDFAFDILLRDNPKSAYQESESDQQVW